MSQKPQEIKREEVSLVKGQMKFDTGLQWPKRTYKCIVCGIEIECRKPVLRCESCRAAHKKNYEKDYVRKKK